MARVDCAQAVRLRMRKTYTFGCMAEHNRRKGIIRSSPKVYALFLKVFPETLFLGLHFLQLQGAEVGVVTSVVDSAVGFVVDSVVTDVGNVVAGTGGSLVPPVDSAPFAHVQFEDVAGKK